MTFHALDRIAERAPGIDPATLLGRIMRGIEGGQLAPYAKDVSGATVYRYQVRFGLVVFPVVAGGRVVTVLSEGMRIVTPTGELILTGEYLPCGIHEISAEQYHADELGDRPSLSSGIARTILLQTPLHAWTESRRLNPDWKPTESATFDVGRAAHEKVLGRGGGVAVYPVDLLSKDGSASTKDAKAFAEEARAAGKTPIKPDVAATLDRMADKLHAVLKGMGIRLDADRSELTALAEVDGVLCRAMVDNAPINPNMPLYDFKTTTDASPDAVRRAVENYGYDVQWQHYTQTWKAATGEARDFRFIFQEKEPPHEVAVIELFASVGHTSDWLETAADRIQQARDRWQECLTANDWPGYPRQIITIGARPFNTANWEEAKATFQNMRDVSRDTLRAAYDAQKPQTH